MFFMFFQLPTLANLYLSPPHSIVVGVENLSITNSLIHLLLEKIYNAQATLLCYDMWQLP